MTLSPLGRWGRSVPSDEVHNPKINDDEKVLGLSIK